MTGTSVLDCQGEPRLSCLIYISLVCSWHLFKQSYIFSYIQLSCTVYLILLYGALSYGFDEYSKLPYNLSLTFFIPNTFNISPVNTTMMAFPSCISQVGKNSVNTALSLIGYEKDLKAAMEFVFGSSFVCPTMETAKKVTFQPGINKRCVTLAGELFDPTGTLTGGRKSMKQMHAHAVYINITCLCHMNQTNLSCKRTGSQFERAQGNLLRKLRIIVTDCSVTLACVDEHLYSRLFPCIHRGILFTEVVGNQGFYPVQI